MRAARTSRAAANRASKYLHRHGPPPTGRGGRLAWRATPGEVTRGSRFGEGGRVRRGRDGEKVGGANPRKSLGAGVIRRQLVVT